MISALWVRMTELNPEYRGLITRIGLWGISCYNLPIIIMTNHTTVLVIILAQKLLLTSNDPQSR